MYQMYLLTLTSTSTTIYNDATTTTTTTTTAAELNEGSSTGKVLFDVVSSISNLGGLLS